MTNSKKRGSNPQNNQSMALTTTANIEKKGESGTEGEELMRENRVMNEKIGELEKKVIELEEYCKTLENRQREESGLVLQIKEKVNKMGFLGIWGWG